MKYGLYALGLIVVGLVAFATAPVVAQTTANGPYYATPSWDQKLPASTRFVILANWNSAAVLDRETGLVWEKVPSTDTVNWFNASSHCNNLDTGGRKGWRLPTIQDLESLIDPTASDPALPSGHPFIVPGPPADFYWSATTFDSDATRAWEVHISSGGVGSVGKSANEVAWCVRGGPGVDRQ